VRRLGEVFSLRAFAAPRFADLPNQFQSLQGDALDIHTQVQ
jgi:hypothetical protein